MKKILTALLLALSLLFTSCDFVSLTNTDSNSQNGNTEDGNDSAGADINSPCPGTSEEDSDDSSSDTDSGDTDGPSDTTPDGDIDDGKNDVNTDTSDKTDTDRDDPENDKDNTDTEDGKDNTDTDGDVTETHSDVDNNGKCDKCGITVIIEINFFVINDFHGKMSDSDTQPGADELSLYLKNLKASYSNSILLASGDMWQGGAESNLTKGLLVTEWMNELDFAAMTLGNHEYDWGEEYIIKNSNAADFPLLAINVYDRATNQRVDYCAPSVTVDLGAIQIGIIGAIGDCYSSISSDKCEDVYFKTGSSLTALVKAESERLRANGADLIVYSLHDGYGSSTSATTVSDKNLSSYYDVSLSSGGYVDVVFEGHSHQTYAFYDSCGVYHIQGGGDNKGFSHVSINFNYANGKDSTNSATVILNSVYKNLEDDPYVAELFEKYADELSKAYEILGYNPSYKSSTKLKQLVADLYYALGEKVWAEEYDIFFGGGYLSTRSPYDLEIGEVTYADLMMLFPFDNEIMLCSIKGYDLKKKFIETTNSNYYVSYGDYGNSIKNNIDNNATYYVIVDSYTAQYKYNNLTVVKTYDSVTFARDLLAEYIRNGGFNN